MSSLRLTAKESEQGEKGADNRQDAVHHKIVFEAGQSAVVGYAISIIQSLTMTELEKAYVRDSGFQSYFSSSSSTVGMVITIGVGLLINFFLFRFCTQAKKATELQDGAALGRSFGNLKSYFMIMGILAIVFAALFVFAFLFGLAR